MRFASTISAASFVRLGAVIAVAAAVAGAKPPPATQGFTPAIGYKYSSGNYTDLRLSNSDGTAAVRLARAAYGGIGMFDLAPARLHQAAYVLHGQPNTLRLVNWTQDIPDGPLTVSLDATPVYTFGFIVDVEYSRYGDQLAFVTSSSTAGPRLHVHDVATKAEALSPVSLPAAITNVAWRESDGAILLSNSQSLFVFKDGQVTPVWSLSMLRDLDVQRAGGGRVLTSFTQNNATFIYFWDGEVAAGAPVLTSTELKGWRAHYNCDNSRIMFHQQIKQPYITYIADATNLAATPTVFASDSNLAFAEFLPTCD